MTVWRVGLVLLPQFWVANAFRTFHEAAMAAPVTVFESARLAVLVDSIAVIAIGWLTVAANLLIAGALVWLTATADGRARRSRAASSLRAQSQGDGVAMSVLSPTIGPGLKSAPSAVSTTPFEHVVPLRAEQGREPA